MKKCVSKLKIFCKKNEDRSPTEPVLLSVNPSPKEDSNFDWSNFLRPSYDLKKPRLGIVFDDNSYNNIYFLGLIWRYWRALRKGFI